MGHICRSADTVWQPGAGEWRLDHRLAATRLSAPLQWVYMLQRHRAGRAGRARRGGAGYGGVGHGRAGGKGQGRGEHGVVATAEKTAGKKTTRLKKKLHD